MAEWITLEEAERAGLDLSWVSGAIGPRRAGLVYLNHYWGNVSTVTGVMVRVERVRDRRGRFARAVRGWSVTEYAPDDVRDRTHMTSWQYGRNTVLCGPGDIRPRAARR